MKAAGIEKLNIFLNSKANIAENVSSHGFIVDKIIY